MTKYSYVITAFLGATAFLIGLLLFNRGKKTTVNLRTDITYIAFAFVLLVSLIYALQIELTVELLALIVVLAMLIAILYQ